MPKIQKSNRSFVLQSYISTISDMLELWWRNCAIILYCLSPSLLQWHFSFAFLRNHLSVWQLGWCLCTSCNSQAGIVFTFWVSVCVCHHATMWSWRHLMEQEPPQKQYFVRCFHACWQISQCDSVTTLQVCSWDQNEGCVWRWVWSKQEHRK